LRRGERELGREGKTTRNTVEARCASGGGTYWLCRRADAVTWSKVLRAEAEAIAMLYSKYLRLAALP